MLKFMRKKARSFFIQISFFIIIIVFVFWGIGSFRSDRGDIVARVDNIPISQARFLKAYQSQVDFYKRIYGEKNVTNILENLDIKKNVLNSLIDRLIILKEARRIGLKVSKEELIKRIQSFPAFQQKGVFNKTLYLRALRSQNLLPPDFEESLREDILIEKLLKIVTDSTKITDEELRRLFDVRYRKVNLRYLIIDKASFKKGVKLKEEDLKRYFESNKESFIVPRRIDINYLVLEPEKFMKGISIPEVEIEKYYKENLTLFKGKKKVKVSQIFLDLPEDADSEKINKIEKEALKIRERALKGEDFLKLIEAYSSKPIIHRYIEEGETFKALEDEVFSLKAGDISKVIKGPLGLHILKVEDIKEAQPLPFDDVKAKIEDALKKEKALNSAIRKANSLVDITLKEGISLKEAASRDGLSVKRTGLFSEGEFSNIITKNQKLSSVAFSLKLGEVSNPISLTDKVYLLELAQDVKEHVPDYKEVKEKVRLSAMEDKATNMAKEFSAEILSSLKNGKDILSLAREKKLKLGETGFFSRKARIVPGIKLSTTIAGKEIFKLNQVNRYTLLEGREDFFVIELVDTQRPDEADFKKMGDAFRERIHKIKEREIYDAWLKGLKKGSEIEIYPEAI